MTFNSCDCTSFDRIGAKPSKSFNALLDVRLDDVFELVAGLTRHRSDHRPNRIDEGANCSGKRVIGVDVLDRRLARAAAAMSQHQNQAGSQFGDGILDASFDRGAGTADDISGNPHDKQVADSLVKNQFRSHA